MLQRRRLRQEFPELTIDEIMTDPMVRDLMRVDHVDPDTFEELLRSLASRSLAHRTDSPRDGARFRRGAMHRNTGAKS
jgi:hypothetical protein